MALLDNLSENDRNRLLMGLGARIWQGGLAGQNVGKALAGSILPTLDEYGQITKEALRAKREQQIIDQANAEADRRQQEDQAWRDYNTKMYGERGLKPVDGYDVRGDAAMPGIAYQSIGPTATTPQEQGLAMSALGAATRNPQLEAYGRNYGYIAAEQQAKGDALDKARLQEADAALKLSAFKSHYARLMPPGLARDLVQNATTMAEAVKGVEIGSPTQSYILKRNGKEYVGKYNPINGSWTYDNVPWHVNSEDALLSGLGGGTPSKAATPAATETAQPAQGLGDRVLNMFSGLGGGSQSAPAISRYQQALNIAQGALTGKNKITEQQARELYLSAVEEGGDSLNYANTVLSQLKSKGMIK